MKAMVTVKRVIDYNVKIHVKSDNSGVDLNHVKMAINPFCEIAVEEAVKLKEAGVISEIIAVSIGDSKSEEQLKTAMALGADRSILVETEEKVSSLGVAKILKAIFDNEKPDLVIMGKQSIDTDNNQTGQMLAALTNLPQGTFASKLKIENNKALITREIDGGLLTEALTIPAIITTDLRLNNPRYATLPNIIKAKNKRIDRTTPENLGITLKSTNKTIKVESPPARKAGIKVNSVDELVQKLKADARLKT